MSPWVIEAIQLNRSENHYQLDSATRSTLQAGLRVAACAVAVDDGVSCQRLRPALGSFVSIHCRATDLVTAERALESAFAAIDTVAQRMHPTRDGSDLLAIRHTRAGHSLQVHPWTWDVLELSKRLNDLSDGCFDPCLPAAIGRISDVDLPAPGLVVRRKSVSIDLGGIAKGYAVDRAIAALQDGGCSEGDVNAGGDLRVFGPSEHTVWIRLRAGASPIALRDHACAVSDPAGSSRPAEHRGYYRRANSGATVPWHGARAAIVLASTAAVADALTKCVLLDDGSMSPRGLEGLLREFNAASIEFRDLGLRPALGLTE